MTKVRGRIARLRAVRGRLGRLAISPGDAPQRPVAAVPSHALRDIAQRGRILRRSSYICVMISLPGSILI